MTCLVWAAVFAMFVVVLLGYFLGCLNGSVLVSHFIIRDDVRQHGSGNAGMTNILRNYGKKMAAFTALGDFGKGIVAVAVGRMIFTLAGITVLDGGYIAGFFVVLGHLFPLYFGFKGGKGVATAAGAILATAPLVVLALAVVFFALAFSTRIVSLSSVTVAALYPVFTFFYSGWMGYDVAFTTFCAAVMGGLVIWMHRANIKRLLNGTEYKFGQDKNKK